MLHRTKRLAAAMFIAGAAIGAVAPVVAAEEERGLSRDVNRVWNRDVHRIVNRDANRIVNRDVDRVVDGAADFTGDAVRYAARELRNILNPR